MSSVYSQHSHIGKSHRAKKKSAKELAAAKAAAKQAAIDKRFRARGSILDEDESESMAPVKIKKVEAKPVAVAGASPIAAYNKNAPYLKPDNTAKKEKPIPKSIARPKEKAPPIPRNISGAGVGRINGKIASDYLAGEKARLGEAQPKSTESEIDRGKRLTKDAMAKSAVRRDPSANQDPRTAAYRRQDGINAAKKAATRANTVGVTNARMANAEGVHETRRRMAKERADYVKTRDVANTATDTPERRAANKKYKKQFS